MRAPSPVDSQRHIPPAAMSRRQIALCCRILLRCRPPLLLDEAVALVEVAAPADEVAALADALVRALVATAKLALEAKEAV